MHKNIFFTLFSMYLIFTSCISKHETIKGTVTESKSVELTKSEFVRNGHKVEDYKVRVEDDSGKKKWIVWFDLKGDLPVPGGKHAVAVEKDTGKVIFLPGE